MVERIPEAAARLALRRLMAAYLAVAGSVLLFPGRPSGWPILLLLHLGGIVLLLEAGPARLLTRPMAARWPRITAAASDWYPLLIMPFLYLELGALNVAVHGGRYFDGTVMGWEEMLFRSQPSQEWASALPNTALSEALHFFYLSYYFIIYLPPLYLWLRGWGGGRALAAHQHMLFTLMLVFLGHYLVFIFFPVQGPRYLFPPPGGELSQGFMYHLAHAILERGSSQGTAFPSSHVGVAFAQTALVFLFLRRAAPLILVSSVGLALGAIYGGFHYAVDVLGGLVLGLLLFVAAPRVAGVLGRGRPAPEPSPATSAHP